MDLNIMTQVKSKGMDKNIYTMIRLIKRKLKELY